NIVLAWTYPIATLKGQGFVVQVATWSGAAFDPNSAQFQYTLKGNFKAGQAYTFNLSTTAVNAPFYVTVWMTDNHGVFSPISNTAFAATPANAPAANSGSFSVHSTSVTLTFGTNGNPDGTAYRAKASYFTGYAGLYLTYTSGWVVGSTVD